MLPVKVTNARIMVFEYESQWFGRGLINQRLSSVADQLVQALYRGQEAKSNPSYLFVTAWAALLMERLCSLYKISTNTLSIFSFGTSHLQLDCRVARRDTNLFDGFNLFCEKLVQEGYCVGQAIIDIITNTCFTDFTP